VLIVCKCDEDRKVIVRRAKPHLVAEGLAAMIAGYVMFHVQYIVTQLTLIGM